MQLFGWIIHFPASIVNFILPLFFLSIIWPVISYLPYWPFILNSKKPEILPNSSQEIILIIPLPSFRSTIYLPLYIWITSGVYKSLLSKLGLTIFGHINKAIIAIIIPTIINGRTIERNSFFIFLEETSFCFLRISSSFFRFSSASLALCLLSFSSWAFLILSSSSYIRLVTGVLLVLFFKFLIIPSTLLINSSLKFKLSWNSKACFLLISSGYFSHSVSSNVLTTNKNELLAFLDNVPSSLSLKLFI